MTLTVKIGKSYRCVEAKTSHFKTGVIYPAVLDGGAVGIKGDWFLHKKLREIGETDYGNITTSAFEEVKEQPFKIGDLVEVDNNNPKNKYEVVGINKGRLWLTRDGRYTTKRELAMRKVKDIRTIECAGGAVRITGEFCRERAGNCIEVKTDYPYYGISYHTGIEVPTSSSEAH